MSTVMSATEDTPLDRVKRTVLQKFDVADGKYEAVVELLEIGPNVVIDRHSHSGPETGYLLEGDATFEFDEQPVLHVKAGQSYVLPADFVHVAKSGPAGAKGIYMWVIEKGRLFGPGRKRRLGDPLQRHKQCRARLFETGLTGYPWQFDYHEQHRRGECYVLVIVHREGLT